MVTHLRMRLGKEHELYEQPPRVPAAEQARVFAVPAWADGHLPRMLFLHKHRLELPTHNTLAASITRALLASEKRLLHHLQ